MAMELTQRLEWNKRIAEYMRKCEYNETLECFKKEASLPEEEDPVLGPDESTNVQVEYESKDDHKVLAGEKKQQIGHFPRFLLTISLNQIFIHLYTEITGTSALVSVYKQDTDR